jgi:hypothetical protein
MRYAESFKGRNHPEDLDADGRIKKRKSDVRVRTGFIWLRIRTRDDTTEWLAVLLCIRTVLAQNTGHVNCCPD